jgi:hypothetical protein
MLHFVHTIEQRGFLRRLSEMDLLEPLHATFRPCLHSQRCTPARAQQEIGQPVPGAQLILLGRLPLTDKIAQCVGIFIRKLQPDFLFGLWMQGLALCTLSRYEEAIETLEKVLVISRAPMFMGLLGAA